MAGSATRKLGAATRLEAVAPARCPDRRRVLDRRPAVYRCRSR